jgi:hypothetical protein
MSGGRPTTVLETVPGDEKDQRHPADPPTEAADEGDGAEGAAAAGEPSGPAQPRPPGAEPSATQVIGTAGPSAGAEQDGEEIAMPAADPTVAQQAAVPAAQPVTEPVSARPAGTTRPVGPGRWSARARTALAIVVIALVALLILAVWALVSRGDQKPGGAGQPSRQTATATASQTAVRSSSPGVAAGFHRYTDSTGFSIAVPASWTGPEHRTSSIFFYAPDRRTYVQIDQTASPNPSALADWRSQDRAAPGRFAHYERLRLGPTGDQPPVPDTGDGSKSADWEFTWGTGSAKKRVLDRGFVTSGHGYAILISAPAGDWATTIGRLRTVFTSFRPAE